MEKSRNPAPRYTAAAMADGGRCILILGLPRSSTTWVTNVLAAALVGNGRVPGAGVVFEPDNEGLTLPAHILKRGLPRFPCVHDGTVVGLPPATRTAGLEAYRYLWEWAGRAPRWRVRWGTRLFSWLRLGGPRFERLTAQKEERLRRGQAIDIGNFRRELRVLCGPRQRHHLDHQQFQGRIIKSVHACLSAAWVAEVVQADAVVVVRRDLQAILASWRRMKLADAERAMVMHPDVLAQVGVGVGEGGDALERMAGQCAVLAKALNHEDLCGDPVAGMKSLCARVGLPWTEAAADVVAQANRPGAGFTAVRDAQREVGKWRGEFTAEELAHIEAIFAALRSG
jgi:hypothetical protein